MLATLLPPPPALLPAPAALLVALPVLLPGPRASAHGWGWLWLDPLLWRMVWLSTRWWGWLHAWCRPAPWLLLLMLLMLLAASASAPHAAGLAYALLGALLGRR
jgi:hypothetical protein